MVATAFRTGSYNGITYSGKYGCLKATTMAILLDREARASVLDSVPAFGKLREHRIVTMTGSGSMMMDPREVDIGDRIRLVTAGGPAATTAAARWETRTIDSVTYTSGQTASFSTYSKFSQIWTGKADITVPLVHIPYSIRIHYGLHSTRGTTSSIPYFFEDKQQAPLIVDSGSKFIPGEFVMFKGST